MRKQLRLDKVNGKLWGVCSGIANYTGVDATIIRIGLVVVTILGAFPWTAIGYAALAFGLKGKRQGSYAQQGSHAQGEARMPSMSTYELNGRTSELDRRLAEVDAYVAGSNSQLAQEIDRLR